MLIPPRYELNQKIILLVQRLERLKTKFDLLPRHKILEKYTRQRSILKSAVYSARIEGNPSILDEISLAILKNPQDQTKLELANLYQTLEFILGQSWTGNLVLSDIQRIHGLVLKGLSPEAGQMRSQPSAIFNTAGVAIYFCPPPPKLKPLLNQLLNFFNHSNEPIIPIKAALTHFTFEKIHPFLDGNGRVGRLLVHLILKKYRWDLRGLIAFEEQLDNQRSRYYDLLALSDKHVTSFIEFFLEILLKSLQEAAKITSQKTIITTEELLPPRRYEILQIIRDHRQVSFNLLKRRFLAVSDRLLRYDLKKLQDVGLIKKRGVTKGAIYEPLASNPD